MEKLQDLSAEGARLLWNMYAKAFSQYNIGTLYIPVADLSTDISKIMERSWRNKKITIWNMNDALTTLHDNDPLAVSIAKHIKADLLIFFTDKGNMGTGGYYSKQKAIEEAEKAGIKVKVQTLRMS